MKMFDMMKQVHQARKMQKELAKKEVQIVSNDKTVTVVARGDMSLRSIRIEPSAMEAGNRERLEKTIVSAVNSALDSAKQAAASDMAKMASGLDIGSLLGGG